MLPVLLDLKFVKIYTFGVFLFLALLWSMFILWKNIKLTSFKEEDMFDLFFTTLIGSLFFARLFYVIFNFSKFGFSILKFILINGYPGLSLYGGLIGGALTFFVFLHRRKIAPKDLVDYFVPSLCVGLAIGKIGSFISGVDVGTKTGLPISVWYSGYSGSRHITAAYESLLFFLAAYITYRIILSVRRTTLPSGFGFAFFVFFFSAVNLLLDKFKENHLYFAGFNVNFWLSLVTLAISGGFFMIQYRAVLERIFTNLKTNILNAKNFTKFSSGTTQKIDNRREPDS